MNRHELAQMIDHTLLKPEATPANVEALINHGVELGVYAICISPSLLPVDARGLKVATVCGFPSGAQTALTKATEAAEAAENGADEIDMVINLGLVKAGAWQEVQADIRSVREAAPDVVLKVIIESAALTPEEIVLACQASQAAGANFVKTSTGFHPDGGATLHAVRLMKDTVGDELQVKASGGIRTLDACLAMIEAGATRLGLSGTAAILAELR